MQLIHLNGREGARRYIRFVRSLYRNDPRYVCTSEFTLRSVLSGGTRYIRSSFVQPLAVADRDRILAVSVLSSEPRLPYLAVGFFEAEQNAKEAVEMLVAAAQKCAAEQGLAGVLIGLNAHLSYGVGIQTDGFAQKSAFDSPYGKPFYPEYFRGYHEETLSVYRSPIATIRLPERGSAPRFTVRSADLRHFDREMEVMREICDRTIGKTPFYTPTSRGHFADLMRDLRPFLKNENLLFAEQDGKVGGFLFWHPDFNQMLSGGKPHTTLGIGLAYLLRRRSIDTVILNAIGSENPRMTLALLSRMKALTEGRFCNVETTFVWDNNKDSTILNQTYLGEPCRRYSVYLIT